MRLPLAAVCLTVSTFFASVASNSIGVFLAVAFFGLFIIMMALVFQPFIDEIKEATDKIVKTLEDLKKR
ncbi:MAG: hypothetical protein HYY55_03110 [Candidatus Niyogibacteria bacterium]|nr:MAG: hypothetical protein HYY55_03110 [Candidatus Niyogibacteria bacterium]